MNKAKTTLVIIIVLIIGLVGGFFIAKKTLNKSNDEDTNATSSTSSSSTATFSSLQKTITTKTIEDKNDTASWKASYPITSVSFVDQDIQKFVNDTLGSFKKDAGDFTSAQDTVGDSNNIKSEASITYETNLVNENILSFKFLVYTYTGGAHGITNVIGKNYDLKNKKEIILSTLFNKNSNYLSELSKQSISQLRASLSKAEGDSTGSELDSFTVGLINSGAGAKAENFEQFGITNNGLVFYFSPYQVAAYAAGPQETNISFVSLSSFLSTEYKTLFIK